MTAKSRSTPSPPPDRAEEVSMTQLLRRVAVSDQTAFAVLYDAMSSQVRAQARVALSTGEAVEAVVAATFLQVWWLAALFNPEDAEAPAWISAITAGRIADRRRDSVFTPPAVDVPARQRLPWSVLSGAYDETVAVVLATLLGRRGSQKAF